MRRTVCLLPILVLLATGRTEACVTDAECADSTVCNGIETCVAGVCQPGMAPNCNDGSLCTADSCDPVTGCRHTAVTNGTSCSDGNVCNGAETCQGGVCTPGTPPNCVDANPCTSDACDSILNHCVYTPVTNGTPCADANVCNGSETCQGGLCAPGMALDCNDGDDCTVDTCDAVLGCAHTVATDGTVCGDLNPCNGNETCVSGVCQPGTAIPPGGSCSDGDVCNGAETCQGGTCAPGTPLDCDDGNICTDDACHPVLGCLHDVAICDDSDPRTTDTCRPGTGCEFHSMVPGAVLLLRASVNNPSRMKLRLVSGAPNELTTPPANGGPGDPVIYGASLRVVTNAFDQSLPLPANHWTYIGRIGANQGYRYRDKLHAVGPIISITMRAGGLTVATGRGADLEFTMPGDPDPVRTVLRLGSTQYCTSFGGDKRFIPDTQLYRARVAPAPAACPP